MTTTGDWRGSVEGHARELFGGPAECRQTTAKAWLTEEAGIKPSRYLVVKEAA